MAKTIVKVEELSKENRLLKTQCDIHAKRVIQLSGNVDTLQSYVVEYKEVISKKDTVIQNLHQAFKIQEAEIGELYNDVRKVKRKGNWKAVGFGIGGFSIGVGVGILIAVLR